MREWRAVQAAFSACKGPEHRSGEETSDFAIAPVYLCLNGTGRAHRNAACVAPCEGGLGPPREGVLDRHAAGFARSGALRIAGARAWPVIAGPVVERGDKTEWFVWSSALASAGPDEQTVSCRLLMSLPLKVRSGLPVQLRLGGRGLPSIPWWGASACKTPSQIDWLDSGSPVSSPFYAIAASLRIWFLETADCDEILASFRRAST